MFKALLYREMRNFKEEEKSNKGPLRVILIFLCVYILLIKFSGIYAAITCSYVIFISIISEIFTKEREVSALSYLAVTPASRYKYIGVKFIVLIELFAALLALNSFMLFISNKVGIDFDGITYSDIALIILFILAISSILMPLTIKFGQNIAAISNLVITFIVVGLIIFIATALENLELTWLKSILSGVNEGTFKIILMIFLVFILFLNYLLSVKFSKYPKN